MNDIGIFWLTVLGLILYLIWSAKTEMGTKNPWTKKRKSCKQKVSVP